MSPNKFAIQLAQRGRPDLVSANTQRLVEMGLGPQGVMRLVAYCCGKYPHSSGEKIDVRTHVTHVRRILRGFNDFYLD